MNRAHLRGQMRGAVLVTALVLMLVLLMLAIAAARAAANEEKTARQQRDREIAFASAEAALADAELDIASTTGSHPGRASLFDVGASGIGKGCGRGADDLGLCLVEPGAAAPAWQEVDLAGDESVTVAYGTFTGARMATGEGPLPARVPRYLVEFLSPVHPPPGSGNFFRITAIGFGASERTRVVLQAVYHKPVGAPGGASAHASDDGHGPPGAGGEPEAALPAGRIGWREVANWTDLHEAAVK
ncbi:pilus assembly protein [Massilia solisilvae]|uniref:Pilus assembly protein n=1 Tax=Massilia solisilvae TaxID=1811225 RepID=A0ABT2BJZ5_9BURK|nr:pilus assembly protein [Massilia solisilvae]MCS0608830.1 pilus assembly protein [Massilia solisilvae]